MNEEAKAHLNKVEQVIETAKEMLSRYVYLDDLRTVLVVAFIDQAIEHHAAMLLLIRAGRVGSAFALARSIFEGLYRGAWILICATEAELERFEREDKLPLNMPEMAKALDAKTDLDSFFVDLLNRGWRGLNSYTHTGLLQLGRRFTGHKLEPAYTDPEIVEITTTTTTCLLLLVRPFFAHHKHDYDAKEIDKLAISYGQASRMSPNNTD
jgi:hypothetical protein